MRPNGVSILVDGKTKTNKFETATETDRKTSMLTAVA